MTYENERLIGNIDAMSEQEFYYYKLNNGIEAQTTRLKVVDDIKFDMEEDLEKQKQKQQQKKRPDSTAGKLIEG